MRKAGNKGIEGNNARGSNIASKVESSLKLNENGDELLPLLEGSSTLEKLRKLEFSRNKFNIPKIPTTKTTKKDNTIRTIAICLVIVDTLHNEQIWRRWIENGENNDGTSPYRARLFIHAKYPEKVSKWARQYTLNDTFLPEWNSPEVIRAMLAVLETALKDRSCERFVMGTESCLPIYPLHQAGELLFAEDKSWLNAFNVPKNPFERDRAFRAVDPSVIPASSVWKSIPGWVLFCRRHAAQLVQIPRMCGDADLVRAWGPPGQWHPGSSGVWAPEEVYFPTMLALLGFLRAEGGGRTDQVKRQRVTFAEFAKPGDANPIAYTSLTATLVQRFRREGCVFARKFGRGAVSVEEWERLVGSASFVDRDPQDPTDHTDLKGHKTRRHSNSCSSAVVDEFLYMKRDDGLSKKRRREDPEGEER